MKASASTTKRKGRWSHTEILKLRRIYGSNSERFLVRVFGRGVSAIERQARHYQLNKNKVFVKRREGMGVYKMPRWSRWELETLRRLHPHHPNLDIARRLGRSFSGVVAQAHTLGLKKSAHRMQGMGQENMRRRWGTKRCR